MQYNAALARQPNLQSRQRIIVLCNRIKVANKSKMNAEREKIGEKAYREAKQQFMISYNRSIKVGNVGSGIDEELTDLLEELRASTTT